jgi:hypothetical protein
MPDNIGNNLPEETDAEGTEELECWPIEPIEEFDYVHHKVEVTVGHASKGEAGTVAYSIMLEDKANLERPIAFFVEIVDGEVKLSFYGYKEDMEYFQLYQQQYQEWLAQNPDK